MSISVKPHLLCVLYHGHFLLTFSCYSVIYSKYSHSTKSLAKVEGQNHSSLLKMSLPKKLREKDQHGLFSQTKMLIPKTQHIVKTAHFLVRSIIYLIELSRTLNKQTDIIRIGRIPLKWRSQRQRPVRLTTSIR